MSYAIPTPHDEENRLASLRSFCILDTAPEPCFEALTLLATRLFTLPIAAISLVDEQRQFFMSIQGLPIRETKRSESFCTHALLSDSPLVISDARTDVRFCDLAMVNNEHPICFYAGAPLITSTGVRLGTFCVLDWQPRTNFGEGECRDLQRLSLLAVQMLEQRLYPEALELARVRNAQLEAEAQEQRRASTAKTDFLSNITHEIRTPMNGVLGMLQLLTFTELSEEQQHYIEVASSCSSTLLSLLDGVLDLSKIEAGKTILENIPFRFGRLVADIEKMWSTQASLKGLSLEVDLDPTVPARFYGDPTRLRQVLNNLLSNAIKFTFEGHILLQARHYQEEPHSSLLNIAVIDTGIGLTPEQAERLFEPFVQADQSTTRNFGGSGLGLALCKRLIALMGGSMQVKSHAGRGSTFSLTVPLVVAVEGAVAGIQQLPLESDRAVLDRVTPQHFKPQTILIAEDLPFNRTVLLAQLKKLGYQADIAENGRQAVEAVQRKDYDVLLMDCEMPVMDGFEATRCIRELGFHKLYIVALTAHAISDNRTRCIDQGMDFFLSKPLVLDYLARVLEEKPQASEGRASPRIAEHSAQVSDCRKVFDGELLISRMMGDRDLSQTLVQAFLADSSGQLQKLKEFISAGDSTNLHLQAHSLKGAAANVSAPELSSAAAALEAAAQAASVESWISLYAQTTLAHAHLRMELARSGWAGPLSDMEMEQVRK